MVLSFLRSKVVVHKSCCTNNIVSQFGFMSGIKESLMQQILLATGDNFYSRFSSSNHYVHLGCLLGLKQIHNSQVFLSDTAKRFYLQNPYPLTRPMPRELVAKALPLMRPKWWKSSKFCLLGVCGLFTACFVRIERIPLTGRLHVVLSEGLMKTLAEINWKLTSGREGHLKKILPSNHLDSIRTESITDQIVEAMNARLMLEKEFKINGRRVTRVHDDGKTSMMCNSSSDPLATEIETTPHEIKSVMSQRRQVQELACKPAVKHLNRRDWKVHVLNSFDENASCIYGQRILVHRGLLLFSSDEKIAFAIGHEIGHAAARHGAEVLAWAVWIFVFLTLIESWAQLVAAILVVAIRRYFVRRNEEEADYIGLMLMASAGYDPRTAPALFSEFSRGGGLFSTHPSGDARAKLLNEANVMEEALELYNEAKANGRPRSD